MGEETFMKFAISMNCQTCPPVAATARAEYSTGCADPPNSKPPPGLATDTHAVVEHHFLEEYSHSPRAGIFLAAASQRTQETPAGHGIFSSHQSPRAGCEKDRRARFVWRRPLRVRHGRERLHPQQLTPFGRDMETKAGGVEEAVAALFPMFSSGPPSITDKYVDIPLSRGPEARCRSRIRRCGWRGSAASTIERAGQQGFRRARLQFVSAVSRAMPGSPYYNAITKRLKKIADYEINPNMALVSSSCAPRTDEEARARGGRRPTSSSSPALLRRLRMNRPATGRRHRKHCGRSTTSGKRDNSRGARRTACAAACSASPETIGKAAAFRTSQSTR